MRLWREAPLGQGSALLMAQMAWVLVWRATFLCDLRWMQYWRMSSGESRSGDLP